MARHVPERADDFVFENNLVCGRIYGQALEGNPTSPGIDIWVNEEGKMRGLDINPIATALSTVFGYDVLVGDALIARTDSEGATLPLTPADLEALTGEIRTLGGEEKK